MRRKLRRATLLFLLAGCFVMAPESLTPAAHALPRDSACTYYYSNSSHTVLVGERMLLCSGQVIITGTVTSFSTTEFSPC